MRTRYYFNERGTFVHVVRDIEHFKWHGEYSHSSVRFRCGNNGFCSKERDAKVYAVPPAGHELCQRCVIANGLEEKLQVKEIAMHTSDGRCEKTLTVTLSNLTEFRLSFPFPATPDEHAEFISKLRELKPGMAPKPEKKPVKKRK